MRVLGRVERFRDRLQLDVRTFETSRGADPAAARAGGAPGSRRARRVPRVPRRGDLPSRSPRARRRLRGRRGASARGSASLPATPDGHHCYAGGLLEHTVGVATLCREVCELHRRLRRDLLLAAALLHDVGAFARARPRAALPADPRGQAARPRPPRTAADRGARGGRSTRTVRAELLHASPCTTTRGPHEPPRRPCSSTRTSSTPSRPRVRSRARSSHVASAP